MAKIKLVIVDDELTSRNTIKDFLSGNELYEVAADFSDGKRALEWLRCNEVDILLCDMQMSEMNGIELIRLVHVIDEFMPVIVISAFDDFAFVRGSLVSGAAEYLLKHEITKEKLMQVLDQVREKYQIVPQDRIIRYRTGYCIYKKEEFTEENIRKLSEEKVIDFSCSNIAVLAVSPDYVFTENVRPGEYKDEICRAILDILAQILGKEYQYLVYYTPNRHLLCLLSFPEISSTLYMINVMRNLENRLKKQAMRLLDITLTLAEGQIQIGLARAVADAFCLENLLKDKMYAGGNRMIAMPVTKAVSYGKEPVPENLWKQFRFELEQGMENFLETLNDILQWMEEKRIAPELVYMESLKMLECAVKSGFLSPMEKPLFLERLKEYEMFETYKREILELYGGRGKGQDGEKYSPLISQVVEYMKQNYTQDISLEKCAELTGSSYTYLSREFRQETGMRFVEFLNRLRVNRAKSLLLRNSCSMKEIAELAGFRNYNYFFKVFKEAEGITPSGFMAKN